MLLAVLAVPQGFKAFFAYSQRLIVDGGILGRNDSLMAGALDILAVGFLLAGTAKLLVDYLRAQASGAIINHLREQMFRHLQQLFMGYFGRVRASDVVARFTSDLADIQKKASRLGWWMRRSRCSGLRSTFPSRSSWSGGLHWSWWRGCLG